jgi:hypothetical protein
VIAEDPELAHCGHRLAPSHQSQLLAQASRHLPEVALCEECLDIGILNAHGANTPCPGQGVICPGCSVGAAGIWAGEWEGTLLPECTVSAPCAVLNTLAAHYHIEGEQPAT